jgi:hypothetical protein
MMKIVGFDFLRVLFVLLISVDVTFGQFFQYQPDKPGKFIFDTHLDKCTGVDVKGVDVTTVQNKLISMVEWVRMNDPVIDHPVGFDAIVGLTALFCDKIKRQEDFGMRSILGFAFYHFYIENGVSCRANGNTSHGTEIFVNSPIYDISTQFDEAEFKTDDPPHLKEPLEKARENLRNYYTTAPVIKEFASGVRLYGPDPGTWFKGSLLVFNPDRPEIWIPVTVKEIMEVKLAYYKVKHEIDSINYEKMVAVWAKMNFNPDPNRTMRPRLYQAIKQEYENFTAEELNLPAWSCASEECGISTINSRGEGRAVVKFNPACWDRSLPVTAVQYLSWQYRPETEEELEKFITRNGGLTDFCGLFFNSLPVEKMGVLIDKK